MDTNSYKPAVHVLDRLKQVHLVIVVGPTSVGKTTTMEAAVARYSSLHFVINETSRAPRSGEISGTDYLFKTREDMEERIKKGDYVQVAPSLFGDLYATAPEGYSTTGTAVLAVLAEVVPLFRSLPLKTLRTVFVIPPSWDAWQGRLASHGFNPEQLRSRLGEAKKSLNFALKDQDLQFVISGDIDLSGEDFATLALGKPLSARLQADQARARVVAQDLLTRLEAS